LLLAIWLICLCDLPAYKHGAEGEKMTGTGRAWTSEEDNQLRTLAAANRNVGAIAPELKRTEAALSGRAYKLGLRFGKPKTRGLGAREN
jgi:hypothetical protein